ncbi:hypothetical protein FY528_19000 [Hymenobacter lutimineralis]|uniref:Uncharacterized protein n=1 Tax=Hymenobacter lutimineralis TaxID=2606448 RepID=A0A5D6UTF4_9BACT|nr:MULTISPECIES: hypothetical protein [Hymenobacter]QIX59912.1 hypothetical protein HER32_01365 [Hymenobacter sp. BT18]TYZ06225.1 hypothetical protein FY528_19000 [Hymenobacter lutimineralis]
MEIHPELVTIRRQMRQLFHERAELGTLDTLRQQWQQTLKALQQQALEPQVALRVANSLTQLAALEQPASVFWSSQARRQQLENALIRAVQEL